MGLVIHVRSVAGRRCGGVSTRAVRDRAAGVWTRNSLAASQGEQQAEVVDGRRRLRHCASGRHFNSRSGTRYIARQTAWCKHLNNLAFRVQSLGEEVANAITHGAGVALAVGCLPILVRHALAYGDAATVVGVTLFSATMILLYLVSTLYHALPSGPAKRWFNRLDHAAIYLFIAGSYMPYLLGVLRGAWGWTLFGIVWGVAAFGVLVKLFDRLRHPLWSTGLYVAMGWIVVIASAPLLERLPMQSLAWLLAGGLSYTLGAGMFLLDSKIKYAHSVWHLFVLAGSACHVWAVVVHIA